MGHRGGTSVMIVRTSSFDLVEGGVMGRGQVHGTRSRGTSLAILIV
jgi:hypothetical protein